MKLVGFTTSRSMTLPSDSGYCYRSDGELWSWVFLDNISLDYVLLLEHVNLYLWNLSNLISIMYLRIYLCELCIVFACILFIQHIYVWYSIVMNFNSYIIYMSSLLHLWHVIVTLMTCHPCYIYDVSSLLHLWHVILVILITCHPRYIYDMSLLHLWRVILVTFMACHTCYIYDMSSL